MRKKNRLTLRLELGMVLDLTLPVSNLLFMKYEIGQLVVERINPTRNLIVTRYNKGIYYVKTVKYFTQKKELVYLESELTTAGVEESTVVSVPQSFIVSFFRSLTRRKRLSVTTRN